VSASNCAGGTLVTDVNVREHFRESIQSALNNQKVDAGEDTVYYVVNLLAYFTHAENLFSRTVEGVDLKPLALIYADAVEAPSVEERHAALKRLGDVALLISGLFSSSLNRKVVDVDYYMAMGGSAYAHLSDISRGTVRGRAFQAIFGELSDKFPRFVDVLAEVSEHSTLSSQTDVMRLYEIWLRTGSQRAADRLRKLGIEPVRTSVGRLQS
jgi:hypothetical protein